MTFARLNLSLSCSKASTFKFSCWYSKKMDWRDVRQNSCFLHYMNTWMATSNTKCDMGSITPLYSPISVGHCDSLKPSLIFNLHQISSLKLVQAILIGLVGNWCGWLFYFMLLWSLIQYSRRWSKSLQEDLGEDLGLGPTLFPFWLDNESGPD